jgi:mRNA interferase MazF
MEELSLRQRDIILITHPYAELSQEKIRPAVIVSNDSYNKETDDMIVCAITTKQQQHPYMVRIEKGDVEGTLHHKSLIRADGLARVHKKLALKRIGKLSQQRFDQTRTTIIKLLANR